MQDDDGPARLVKATEHLVHHLPISLGRRHVRNARGIGFQELDLDPPPPTAACLIETGVHREAMEPGLEPGRISKLPEIPPGTKECLLDRVTCELGVPEDQARGFIQPHDGRTRELGEGVMIAFPRALDEPLLVHRHPLGLLHSRCRAS